MIKRDLWINARIGGWFENLCSAMASLQISQWQMNKMNGHTQGGGVQDVIQVQFKVLLPNGCQGLTMDKEGGTRGH